MLHSKSSDQYNPQLIIPFGIMDEHNEKSPQPQKPACLSSVLFAFCLTRLFNAVEALNPSPPAPAAGSPLYVMALRTVQLENPPNRFSVWPARCEVAIHRLGAHGMGSMRVSIDSALSVSVSVISKSPCSLLLSPRCKDLRPSPYLHRPAFMTGWGG